MTAAGDPIESDASAAAAVRSSGLMAVQVNAPSAGALRVEIYSLDGRRIYSSTSDLSGAGVYAFRWDGLLESGSQASPGVYLVTVSHNGETQQTRLVKVRP